MLSRPMGTNATDRPGQDSMTKGASGRRRQRDGRVPLQHLLHAQLHALVAGAARERVVGPDVQQVEAVPPPRRDHQGPQRRLAAGPPVRGALAEVDVDPQPAGQPVLPDLQGGILDLPDRPAQVGVGPSGLVLGERQPGVLRQPADPTRERLLLQPVLEVLDRHGPAHTGLARLRMLLEQALEIEPLCIRAIRVIRGPIVDGKTLLEKQAFTGL